MLKFTYIYFYFDFSKINAQSKFTESIQLSQCYMAAGFKRRIIQWRFSQTPCHTPTRSTVGGQGYATGGLETLAPYDTALGSQTPYDTALGPGSVPHGGRLDPI
jgi:hypothetical protein